jgi:hypothetical protein
MRLAREASVVGVAAVKVKRIGRTARIDGKCILKSVDGFCGVMSVREVVWMSLFD